MGLLHHPFRHRLVFRHFWGINFQPFVNYFVWLRIIDEGSVPELRIWSILLIKSDLKWCIHLSRSLFMYFNYLVSLTAVGPRSPQGHMKPSSTVDFGWFVVFGEHQNFPCLKLIEIVILWVYYSIPFGFVLYLGTFGASMFNHLLTTLFGWGSLTRAQYPKCAYGPYF